MEEAVVAADETAAAAQRVEQVQDALDDRMEVQDADSKSAAREGRATNTNASHGANAAS